MGLGSGLGSGLGLGLGSGSGLGLRFLTLTTPNPAPHQEWKKAWAGQGGYGATTGVEPLGEGPRYSARVRNFTISTEGISVITSRLGPHDV